MSNHPGSDTVVDSGEAQLLWCPTVPLKEHL